MSPSVIVCSPSDIIMTSNITADVVSKVGALETGLAYLFNVAIVDPYGNVCKGDTQNDATQLSIEIVKSLTNVVEPLVPVLSLVGNTTNVANVVQAVAGQYAFNTRLTASTMVLRIPGVRVRVTAKSPFTPLLRTTAAFSGAFQTFVSGRRLRIDPSSDVPSTAITGYTTITLNIQAVDDLDVPEWTAILPDLPNVAKAMPDVTIVLMSTLGHSNTAVRNLPLVYSVGDDVSIMADGEAQLSFVYAGDDMQLCFTVHEQRDELIPTTPVCVKFTRVTQLVETATFQKYFTRGNGVYSIAPGTTFVDGIAFADALGKVVTADQSAVLGVRLIKSSNTTSTVALQSAQNFTLQPVYYNMSRNGTVNFYLWFAGSTEETGLGTYSTVQLEYYCETAIPDNPCNNYSTVPILSKPILVGMTTAKYAQPISVIVPLLTATLQDLGITGSKNRVLNFTELRNTIMTGLIQSTGNTYIMNSSYAKYIGIMVCRVETTIPITALLSSYAVCGPNSICTERGDPACPTGIVQCLCDGVATAATARHHFQALLTAAPVTLPPSTEIRAQFTFDFSSAPGLTESELARANVVLAENLETMIVANNSKIFAAYGMDISRVQRVVPISGPTAAPLVFTLPTKAPMPTIPPNQLPTTLPPYDVNPNLGLPSGALPRVSVLSVCSLFYVFITVALLM